MQAENIEIYTDGACSGNPGPGGWGAVLRYGKHEKEIFGSHPQTTNNRMELQAVIEALKSLTQDSKVHVYTDSRYVHDGMTLWIKQWKRKGWKTADKKPVRNQDLWEDLDTEVQKHDVVWHWVKGHSNHPENDRADLLARNAIIGAMVHASQDSL